MSESNNTTMNVYISESPGLLLNNVGVEVSQHGPRAKFLKSRKNINLENLLSFFNEKNQKNSSLIDLNEIEIDGEIYYPFIFSKSLDHNKFGLASSQDVQKLLDFINNKSIDNLKNIELSENSNRLLEGISNFDHFSFLGRDSSTIETIWPDDILSKNSLFELFEVYLRSYTRDIPFIDYFQSKGRIETSLNLLNNILKEEESLPVKDIISPLNLDSNNKLTLQSIFRSPGIDEHLGPLVSQFLLKSYMNGTGIDIEQRYKICETNDIASITQKGWTKIQNGEITGSDKSFSNKNYYIFNGRALGSLVRSDITFEWFNIAALILLQNKAELSIKNFENVSSTWLTCGPPDIFSTISHVAIGALRIAWFTKWKRGMRIRPEVLAQRINLAFFLQNNSEVSSRLTNFDPIFNMSQSFKDVLNLVKRFNNVTGNLYNSDKNEEDKIKTEDYLLQLLYPEGSPIHPSWPAGHATISGACVTILKAMFKTHEYSEETGYTPIKWNTLKNSNGENLKTLIASSDGNSLEDYNETDKDDITIVGELNKLASNISLGRDWAAVHYRCDSVCGIIAGETFAISYLQSKLLEYSERYPLIENFFLQKFDGTFVKIYSDRIIDLNDISN